ncbi:MAG: hypothetical protein MI864_26410, partial [Pseudomonadales bacterium]|nr:hypothetical protein [Pseudomonadales bacterium]
MTITMPPKRLSKLALQVLACTSCALLAQSAQSHTDSSPATSSTKASTHQPQTTVNGALQVTYRTDDSTSQNLWQIPGILLGGEAHGYERGPALDSANLTIRHVHDNGLYGVIEIGSHSHDGEAEVEFEEVLVGYHLPLPEQNATAVFEAGHLNARFSPFNHQHANEKASSEDHLAYAAFFGGHFTDNGLRAHLTHDSGWTLGIEAWQGNEYPGDGTHAAIDGYIHHELKQDKWKTNAGIWAFQTQSEVRT